MEYFMPDDILPATEPVTEATTEAAPSNTEPDSVYDAAFTEHLDDSVPDAPEQAAGSEATNETAAPTSGSTTVITDGEKAVLKRAGLLDEMVSGWSRPQIEAFVAAASKTQAEQDRLGAEYANLKKSLEEREKTPQKPEAEQRKDAPQPTPFEQRVTELFGKLSESYDSDIVPLGELLVEMDRANASARQHAEMIPQMANIVTELVIDMTLEAMAKDFPSISKPDGRKAVVDRFWTEWSTGAYNNPDVSIREQLRSALTNAAKVTFINTNEQTAAANLVTANKARLKSQPKPGSTSSRTAPKSADDVYDQVYAETMGRS